MKEDLSQLAEHGQVFKQEVGVDAERGARSLDDALQVLETFLYFLSAGNWNLSVR